MGKSAFVGVIVLVAAAILFYATRQHDTAVVPAASVGSAAVTRLAIAADAPTAATNAVTPNAASTPKTTATVAGTKDLPPLEAPLAGIYADLKTRADAGDAGAACRLSFELARCSALPEARARVDSLLTGAAQGADGKPSAALLDAQGFVDRATPVCAGMSDDQRAEAWRYLLQAAQAGHVASMRRLAIQPPIDEAHPEMAEWAGYRGSAFTLLQRAAEAGDPQTIYFLYSLYSGGTAPGNNTLVVPDPKTALSYAYVARRYADDASRLALIDPIAKLEAGLDKASLRQAEIAAGNRLDGAMTAGRNVNFSGNLVPDTAAECAR